MSSAIIPSKELVETFSPGVPITRELGAHETLFQIKKSVKY
jgi:hypothetical protein